jgi:hypothetical protein
VEDEIHHYKKGSEGHCRRQLTFLSDFGVSETGRNRLEKLEPAREAFRWREIRPEY